MSKPELDGNLILVQPGPSRECLDELRHAKCLRETEEPGNLLRFQHRNISIVHVSKLIGAHRAVIRPLHKIKNEWDRQNGDDDHQPILVPTQCLHHNENDCSGSEAEPQISENPKSQAPNKSNSVIQTEVEESLANISSASYVRITRDVSTSLDITNIVSSACLIIAVFLERPATARLPFAGSIPTPCADVLPS